jgi:uncharacterized protein YndB with AHSA1/START domain
MAGKPSLTIRRRVDAPPAQVYAAWTDPKRMVRWWGPGAAEAHVAEADPRVGGWFRVKFRTPDGEEHDVRGIYRDVVPNRRLVFTWAWRTMPERESLVTVALQSEGEGTLLVLTHEQFFDESARDRHEYGWNAALDKLERYLT